MRTDAARLPGQREAIDAVLVEQGLKNLEKLLPKTEKGWLQFFAVLGMGVLGGVGIAIGNNPDASVNFGAWKDTFFGPIPSNHVTDISTVGPHTTECKVEFQEGFSVGEKRNGELVVLNEQGEVIGLLGDGVCPGGTVVKTVYHRLKPGVLDVARGWNAINGNKRWGGSVSHGLTGK